MGCEFGRVKGGGSEGEGGGEGEGTGCGAALSGEIWEGEMREGRCGRKWEEMGGIGGKGEGGEIAGGVVDVTIARSREIVKERKVESNISNNRHRLSQSGLVVSCKGDVSEDSSTIGRGISWMSFLRCRWEPGERAREQSQSSEEANEVLSNPYSLLSPIVA